MNIAEKLRLITAQDFAAMGMQQVAYVRPALVNGISAFAIHAADGSQIGVAPNREVALAAIVQNELEPVTLH
jgi:hypothetical protein